MFTNKDLRKLILPLFAEQFLLMFVGIAGTFTAGFSSEADVMAACETYLIITTLSLPFFAFYDACATLCRSTGKTACTGL